MVDRVKGGTGSAWQVNDGARVVDMVNMVLF